MTPTVNRRQIWFMPVSLLLLSTMGLLSALLGDGWWDVMSWGTLGYAVVVVLWYVLKPP